MNGADFSSMMDLAQAARAAGGEIRGEAVSFTGVATDSRAITPGDLFVALVGERFDGHDYVAQARVRGAVAAITSRYVEAEPPIPQALVPDTKLALGKLAAHWRSRYSLPVVALTGSNGKTTVKEMLASILAAEIGDPAAVLATEGNLNNDIGMPLTLLRLRSRHHYAVIEMGMNHEGEIAYLTRIARPGVAIVNNAQRAHVGILGSLQAIARAKGEIYSGLDRAGVAVVNEDDPHSAYWKGLNEGRRIVTFGLSESADVRALPGGDQLRIVTPADAFAVRLQVPGEHNVRNALAACAAAHALNIPGGSMQAGLADFKGVPGRLQRRQSAAGGLVIDDSYNANPESMKAAIKVLAAEAGRRVFVMGDMGELGDASMDLHAEVGAFARNAGIDTLYAVGEASREATKAFGPGARHFDDVDALIAALRGETRPDSVVLVKGSRFMQMERVADALTRGGGHAA